MPGKSNYPVPPATLADDRQTIKALKELSNYTPHRPEHTTEALLALEASLTEAEDTLMRSQLAVDVARLRCVELSWALHRGVVGARDEVAVLFGPDSHAVHAVGRKRVSEHKRPTRRATSA